MALPPVTNPADAPGLVFRVGVATLYPLARHLTTFDHSGEENLPKSGPVLVVCNHVSNFDPVVLGAFLVANGRWPHWMAKKELFSTPVVGWLARRSDQIPVDRQGPNPMAALDTAVAALDKGMTVIIYPEGTITADPLHWPMTGRTGAARIALRTGVPVIPVGQWGPQEVMGYKDMTFPKLWPRRTMHLRCGPPVDLSDLHDDHRLPAMREATNRIMDAIDAQVALARGETPPPDRYDMRSRARVPKAVAPARPVSDPPDA